MREKKTIESNDLILNYIYVYAMRDATMRGASPFTKGTKAKKKEMENLDDFPKIHQALKLFINSVLSNKIRNYKDYSKRLVDLSRIICCEINSYYKGEAHFTFGNAQKLINMVMKRLYTVCYNDHDKRDSFKYCHCPMDGQLIQAVGFKKISWSKIDFIPKKSSKKEDDKDIPVEYKSFQDAVKKLSDSKGIYPIEYDYINWNKLK